MWGSGEFEAPRGSRKHKGIDIVAPVGAEVISVTNGDVTKIGFPYAQDPLGQYTNEDERRAFYLKKAMRYVQITTLLGRRVRYFYVDPVVEVGDKVYPGETLGTTQDLGKVYPGITPHFHFEVMDDKGAIMNPYTYLGDLM